MTYDSTASSQQPTAKFKNFTQNLRHQMGLLTLLKKLKRLEKETRLLILGLDNAGKTSIVAKLSGESLTGISPTLGFNITTLEYNSYKLNLWDIGILS